MVVIGIERAPLFPWEDFSLSCQSVNPKITLILDYSFVSQS